MNVEPDAELVAGAVVVELAGVVLLGAGRVGGPSRASAQHRDESCRTDYSCGSRTSTVTDH
ncbi:hypothetical protein ACHMZP_26265 [Rhodococcus baikonurensis]|uniref:hypothetical protein n=1 Tax=Rhodococcus baikonurensis TaxID=172041 RepID=UPI0037B19BBD